jgi:hypothetical protein
MKPDSNLLFLTLAIVVSLGVSACDKATGPISDGSVPSFRGISNQLRSTCPSLDSQVPDDHEPAPWPTATDSVDVAIYDTRGVIVTQAHLSLGPHTQYQDNAPRFVWNLADSKGQTVSTGHYFQYFILRDSTGAVVGRDSLCIGLLRSSQ